MALAGGPRTRHLDPGRVPTLHGAEAATRGPRGAEATGPEGAHGLCAGEGRAGRGGPGPNGCPWLYRSLKTAPRTVWQRKPFPRPFILGESFYLPSNACVPDTDILKSVPLSIPCDLRNLRSYHLDRLSTC